MYNLSSEIFRKNQCTPITDNYGAQLRWLNIILGARDFSADIMTCVVRKAVILHIIDLDFVVFQQILEYYLFNNEFRILWL